MSWIQKLYDTYEQCAEAAQFANKPLQPIGHTTQQAHIEIIIDGRGNFSRANVLSKGEQTTLIPCTEESGGRSGKKPVNHPLCDKLQYVAGDFVQLGGEVTSGFANDPSEPHRNFIATLFPWSTFAWATLSNSHPKLAAIVNYVQKGRIVHDLVNEKILFLDNQGKFLKEWGGDKKGTPPIFSAMPNGQNPEDAFIRWRVEISGDSITGTWEDAELLDAWIQYYASQQQQKGLCLASGLETTLAEQHPSKIRNDGDKAKIVSSNDNSGFTFRGRFVEANQACGVGFEVTQKAHKALQWLIRRQSFRNGDQVIVAWNTDGKEIPDPFKNSADIVGLDVGQANTTPTYQGDAGQAFALRLNNCFRGYRAKLGSTDGIVVMGLDSATPGRMAITYYRELTGSEYLDRIQAWHTTFAWHQDYGRDAKTKQLIRFIGTPSPKDIAEAAYGRPKDKQHEKLIKATVERLLPCIIDGQVFPRDLRETTFRRTCNRIAFEKDKYGKEWEWEKNLGIACALIKGAYIGEEIYQMTLETNRVSRDYLYGRLLAVADSIESFALTKAEKNRDTTAAKLMQRFSSHPFSTWKNIELALKPYMSRLRTSEGGIGFLVIREKLLDEVVCAFQGNDFTDDRPLSGEFLLGYHCQRRELNKPKPQKTGASATDDETTGTDNQSTQGEQA